MIQFTLIVDNSSSYIESIHIRQYQSVEQDPLSARRLKLMASLMDGRGASPELKVGEHLPDFSLIDQSNQNVTLSQYSGKVVAITFTYTHCALPNFCFRIANSFRTLQKRFASQMGSDLILLTITFDPAHDTPKVMAQYGKTWNADPKSWHLLTGPPDQVQQLCARFGISFWPDEGLMTHSLHTLVVDRNGNLVTDLEGNEFTADQLGDLVQSVLVRDPHRSAESVGR
jgi:protein SCO1/2